MSLGACGRFTIVNERGLHARAASKLSTLASSFACTITISGGEQAAVSAKSVMGILLLCATKGTEVEVMAEGTHAEEAVRALGALIAAGFDEGRA